MAIKTLEFDFEVKEVTEAGSFAGYGSVFGNVDQGGDIVAPGAFLEFLAKGRMPSMLFGHQSRELPVGKYQTVKEDTVGLWVEGALATDTQRGGDLHKLMKMKAITGMSIGYVTRDDSYDRVTGIRTLKKVDLPEVSLVNFPMNDAARVASVKSAGGFSERDFERLMQDAGLSRKEARVVLDKGFRHLMAMQDAGGELDELAAAIKRNIAQFT